MSEENIGQEFRLKNIDETTNYLIEEIKLNELMNKKHKKVCTTLLENFEVVLVHCNLVNNNYQHTSELLFTFVPDKQFSQLITIAPHSLTMLKTTNIEFQYNEVWFTDPNNRPLEIEDNLNITLIIGAGQYK